MNRIQGKYWHKCQENSDEKEKVHGYKQAQFYLKMILFGCCLNIKYGICPNISCVRMPPRTVVHSPG